MAKAAIQSTVLTSNGGIAIGGGAQVTVKDSETGSLVSLWEERAGSTVKANPFNADSNGHFLVYANPGTVDIEIASGAYTQTIKYFPIFVIGGVQNNYSGDGAPTVNDDASAGYSQDSLWFDTTSSPKEVYRCVDATTGAADWLNTTLEVGELGSAAVQDVGTTIGDVVQLEDVAGSPGLPAVDGSQLTGVTAETGSAASVVTITPGSDADYTLSAAENAATIRVLETGSWTTGHSLIGDDADREFTVVNNSGSTATITTDGATPTTVDVPTGKRMRLITRAGVGAEPGVSIIQAPVRQTVLTGPVDSDGRADSLAAGTGLEAVTSGLATDNLIATWGDGFGSYGKIDYAARLTSDLSFSGLTDNDTNFLYIDLDPSDGSVTTGSTTLAPEYSYAKPSTPSTNQYWYPVDHRSRGEYYDGAAWQPVYRLFIGEAVTSGGSVASVVSYAYQGKYTSSERAGQSSGTESFTHNIGAPAKGSMFLVLQSSTGGFLSGSAIKHPLGQDATSARVVTLSFDPNSKTCSFAAHGDDVVLADTSGGASTIISRPSHNIFLRAERSF